MAGRKNAAVRRTISLPADLDERMSKHSGVNWSQVAAEAFQNRLRQLSTKMKGSHMGSTIERLRASKMEHASESRVDGVAAGSEWAKDYAEFPQLKRLGEWMDENGHQIETILSTGENDAFGAGHHLACAIEGDQLGRHSGDAFWDAAIGDDDERRYDDEFVQGFAEGAMTVWETVKDQV